MSDRSRPSRAGGPFVGRAAELGTVASRIEEGARLVTLVGPGGIGKTALALEAARRSVEEGRRGRACAALLASADGVAGIADAVAVACGAELDAATDPVVRVGAALAALGEILVVLDDFDGLVAHALETIGAWLELAPEAAFLVTSRERLGLVAEVIVEVGPLVHGGADLLVMSARRASSAFALRAGDEAYIAEIVRSLEGVPLALELAGARLPLFGARAFLHRLRASPEPLRRDARGGEARHASLDAAVRGSFDALSDAEQDALAQLTVFRGGFTADAVAAVVEVRAHEPLALLEALRARSLVRTRDAAGARFDLYEAVRAFAARERPGPIAAATARHASYFVAAAERAASDAYVVGDARAFLVDERENVLAVARRVLDAAGPPAARDAEIALRAVVALSSVLLARGPLAAVSAVLSPIVERTRDSGADPRLAARALVLRGALRRERGETRPALKDLLAAESIARALHDDVLAADARVELGRALLAAGEVDAARRNLDRAAQAYAAAGARGREAEATAWLGAVTASAGDLASARALLERAAALAGGDRVVAPFARMLLARAAADVGDLAAARGALDEVARAAEADDDARAAAEAAILRGLVARDAGDADAAREALARARDVAAERGLDADAAVARGWLGVLAREAGRAEAYALLAEARDACARAGRASAALIFAEHLAALDAEVGRAEAAQTALAAAPRPAVPSLGDAIAARVSGAAARAAATPAPPPPPDDALVVGAGGGWFRAPGGSRVGLERRRSLALLVDRLAAERLAKPGAALSSAALFAAAWPGERALASAGTHRVRVALASLRKMGLRELLVTTPDGYLLATATPLVRVDGAGPGG